MAKGNLEKPLILWNRTKEQATEHSEKIGHSSVAGSLQEVATNADVIWTCLADETAIGETMNELLKGDVKGKLFVDSSTISPTFTNELSKRVLDAGAEFAAVPGMFSFYIILILLIMTALIQCLATQTWRKRVS